MKFYYFTVLALTFPLMLVAQTQPDYELWYEQPATFFEETLPQGNGLMGTALFGNPSEEKIYLNHMTLWAGEPVNPYMRPEAYKHLPAVREALFSENYPLADSLVRNLQGSYSQSYAPLGTLRLFTNHQNPIGYERRLELENGVSTVRYESNGVQFQRKMYVSYPDNIIVLEFQSDQPNTLDFELGFESLLPYSTQTEGEQLSVFGQAPYHAEPNYRGNIPEALKFAKDRGTRFCMKAEILHDNGTVSRTDSSLVFKNGNQALIIIAIQTSFNGFDKDPFKAGKDEVLLANQILESAIAKDATTLFNRHLADYQSFYNRVHIYLGENPAPALPTDKRLLRYTQGKEDPYLEGLYFQFGRYLLMSSSRTPEVPANLQGIWNPHMRPPWSSNYTMNINVEMNYWLAETTNLSELHMPLLTFIKNLEKTGRITAKTFYNASGWTASHNSDIWAMTNPVGDFGRGFPVWANWSLAGAWLSTHLWEHYAFTQDQVFLENEAYPLMKGAVEFLLDYLVEDKYGYLVTAPGTSPENLYKTPDGYVGGTLYGATSDLAMIRELFLEYIEACKILNKDPDLSGKVAVALEQLYPYQISAKGHLQEWYHDWEDQDIKHRHQSHLFGLHPGSHITPQKTPKLAAASKKTLENKGDESTGWSKGWRINLWARLQDGDRAHKLYRELLTYVDPSGKTKYGNGGGTYPNLFDAHPPFQIDGNFGGTAGVVEMLLQSHQGYVELLPALPKVWQRGNITGLKARGGFEIDLSWDNNELQQATIKCEKGGEIVIRYREKTLRYMLQSQQELILDKDLIVQ